MHTLPIDFYTEGRAYICWLTGRESVSRQTLRNWRDRGYPVHKGGTKINLPYQSIGGKPVTTRKMLDKWWRDVIRESKKAGLDAHNPWASALKEIQV